MKFERAFSKRSYMYPALTRSSLAQKVLVPHAKVFVSSTINAFVFYLEGGLENHRKEQKLGKKVSLKLHFS